MTKAVIQGNYSDIKNVKTRSCVQIIIEVPIEHAAQIQAVLGWPQPGSEIPVAIARLHDGAADNHEVNEPTSNAAAAPSPDDAVPDGTFIQTKPKQSLDDMPYPQQAALLCKQEPFQAWIERRLPETKTFFGDREQRVRSAIHVLCKVESRSEFQPDTRQGRNWQRLYKNYKSEHPY